MSRQKTGKTTEETMVEVRGDDAGRRGRRRTTEDDGPRLYTYLR